MKINKYLAVAIILALIVFVFNFPMFSLCAAAYFIPSIIAFNKKHYAGIFYLNLFLGWTFLGWVGALVWAHSSPKQVEA